MRLLEIIILMTSVYVMHVTCQSFPGLEPVVVEVPGLFGKYGGYILAVIILLVSYLNNFDDNVVRINVGGETMTMSGGNGNGPVPTP